VYGWRAMMDKYVADNNIAVPKLLMTEAYANISFTMKYYQSDDGTQQGANMPFNFQLIYGIEGTPTPKHLKDNIDYFLDHMPPGKSTNWVTGSHDHSRVASRAGPNYVDIANVVALTLPGVSITYYVSATYFNSVRRLLKK
jgi:alpha-glucosidase